ncbi:hypothetical protein Tco_1515047 [Tanacetum coccineum]
MGYKSKGNFVYRPVLTLNWNGVARKNGEENKKKSNSNTNIASTSQDRGKSVVSTSNAFSIRSNDNMLKDKENKSGNVLEVLRILLKSYYAKDSRIILGWNDNSFDVMILSCTSQAMHTLVILKADQKVVYCTFVYASNSYIAMRELWHSLGIHKQFVNGRP